MLLLYQGSVSLFFSYYFLFGSPKPHRESKKKEGHILGNWVLSGAAKLSSLLAFYEDKFEI
jgi:hypothetical protein